MRLRAFDCGTDPRGGCSVWTRRPLVDAVSARLDGQHIKSTIGRGWRSMRVCRCVLRLRLHMKCGMVAWCDCGMYCGAPPARALQVPAQKLSARAVRRYVSALGYPRLFPPAATDWCAAPGTARPAETLPSAPEIFAAKAAKQEHTTRS